MALAAGCGGGLLQSDVPAAETFRLALAPPASTSPCAEGVACAATTLPLGLAVARPRAPTALDTDRLAIVTDGSRFDYYSGIRWAESVPLMLQQQFVASLAARGRFGGGVFASPARVPAELLLDLELRRYEAVAGNGNGGPVVHVQTQASLVDTRRAARVATFTSTAEVAASENRLAAVVAAFEQATAKVVADVTGRVEEAAASLRAD